MPRSAVSANLRTSDGDGPAPYARIERGGLRRGDAINLRIGVAVAGLEFHRHQPFEEFAGRKLQDAELAQAKPRRKVQARNGR